MRLLTIILSIFTVAVAAPYCDPETQYSNQDGLCCKKCGPGTRMSESPGTCPDPLCAACAEDEYQAGHTTNTRCDLQPYCDPNKRFVPDAAASTKRETVCVCKDGYHCASAACITCVAHSRCTPGRAVRDKGNHAHDTVCQDCPPNTFSAEESAGGDCQNWTVCGPGFQTKTSGTATSDRVCEEMEQPLSQWKWIIPVFILIVFLVVVLGLLWKCRGNATKAREKDLEDADTGARPRTDGWMIIRQPQEEDILPEENEDQLVYPQQPISSNGTGAVPTSVEFPVLSRQESQPELIFTNQL